MFYLFCHIWICCFWFRKTKRQVGLWVNHPVDALWAALDNDDMDSQLLEQWLRFYSCHIQKNNNYKGECSRIIFVHNVFTCVPGCASSVTCHNFCLFSALLIQFLSKRKNKCDGCLCSFANLRWKPISRWKRLPRKAWIKAQNTISAIWFLMLYLNRHLDSKIF